MNQEEFVDCLRSMGGRALKGVVKELRQGPTVPDPDNVRCSRWFRALAEPDQKMVESVVVQAIKSFTWNILCELDGVGDGVAGNPEEGMYQLHYIQGGTDTLLNSPLLQDPELEELHAIFSSPKP